MGELSFRPATEKDLPFLFHMMHDAGGLRDSILVLKLIMQPLAEYHGQSMEIGVEGGLVYSRDMWFIQLY